MEGGEWPSLINTVASTVKTANAVTCVAAAATAVTDESCTRAAAANIKQAVLE